MQDNSLADIFNNWGCFCKRATTNSCLISNMTGSQSRSPNIPPRLPSRVCTVCSSGPQQREIVRGVSYIRRCFCGPFSLLSVSHSHVMVSPETKGEKKHRRWAFHPVRLSRPCQCVCNGCRVRDGDLVPKPLDNHIPSPLHAAWLPELVPKLSSRGENRKSVVHVSLSGEC